MSIGGFIVGLFMMAVGFFMVRHTNWFISNFGNIGEMFGYYEAEWGSWKIAGIVFLMIGFMIAFGLFGLIVKLIFGSFFLPAF